MASAAERTLAMEWLGVLVVETGDALYHSSKKKFTLPSPQRYFATMVAYLILAGVALFGEKAGRVAAALGGLVALTILLAPATIGKPVNATTNPVLLVSFFKWLTEMFENPPTTISQPVAYAGQVQGLKDTTTKGITPATGLAPLTTKAGAGFRNQQLGSGNRGR